jgi:hypothetical protein
MQNIVMMKTYFGIDIKGKFLIPVFSLNSQYFKFFENGIKIFYGPCWITNTQASNLLM